MTHVVNLRDLKVGGRIVLPPDTLRIDRGSPWGNPFRIGDPDPNGYPMDRTRVIGLYERYMEAKAAGDPTWLSPLYGKSLACWCAPLACHGELILRWLSQHPRP